MARKLTAEEIHMRDVVAPQQKQQKAEVAEQVRKATRKGWRDRLTPARQERIRYDKNHPRHPRYKG